MGYCTFKEVGDNFPQIMVETGVHSQYMYQPSSRAKCGTFAMVDFHAGHGSTFRHGKRGFTAKLLKRKRQVTPQARPDC